MLQHPNANGIFSKFILIPHVIALMILNFLQDSNGSSKILWSYLTLGNNLKC